MIKRKIFFNLVAKELSNNMVVKDKEKLDKFLKEKKYQELYKQIYGQLNICSTISSQTNNLEHGLDMLRRKITRYEQMQPSPNKVYSLTQKFMLIAASVLLFLGLGYTLRYLLTPENPEQITQIVTVITHHGEKKNIILPDNSSVWLNSGGVLSYPKHFSKKKRNVTLHGEAFFEVTHNRNAPFTVVAGDLIITVLGTAFNISQNNNRTAVTVERGKVKVSDNRGLQMDFLEKNQQIKYELGAHQFVKANVDAALYTCWKDGSLVFNEIPLPDAIKKTEEWFNVKIIHNNNNKYDKRMIRTKYQRPILNNVLDDMKFIFNISYSFMNDSTVILY